MRNHLFFKLFIYSILSFPLPIYSEKVNAEGNNGLSSSLLLDCKSLEKIKVFAIHPQYSIDSAAILEKVNHLVAEELGKLGSVIQLKVPDLTGYGNSQAQITMRFNNIPNTKDQKFPISDLWFLISSATIVEKTQVKCQSYIWIQQSYIDGKIDDNNAENILTALKNSLNKFADQYREVNPGLKQKPVFYLYTP